MKKIPTRIVLQLGQWAWALVWLGVAIFDSDNDDRRMAALVIYCIFLVAHVLYVKLEELEKKL